MFNNLYWKNEKISEYDPKKLDELNKSLGNKYIQTNKTEESITDDYLPLLEPISKLIFEDLVYQSTEQLPDDQTKIILKTNIFIFYVNTALDLMGHTSEDRMNENEAQFVLNWIFGSASHVILNLLRLLRLLLIFEK